MKGLVQGRSGRFPRLKHTLLFIRLLWLSAACWELGAVALPGLLGAVLAPGWEDWRHAAGVFLNQGY